MYQKLPNLVLGFHGCHRDVFQEVTSGETHLKSSDNDYDWLGNGIYFWEQNYTRAYEWAVHRFGSDAAVIGAVIDLGYCLNLTDSASAEILRQGYAILHYRCEITKADLPQNKRSPKSQDILLRHLDCAVIQQIHDFNRTMEKPEFDSVRGIFTEGGPVYEGAAFLEKTHVQLCVRNPNCIKGYFVPLTPNDSFVMP